MSRAGDILKTIDERGGTPLVSNLATELLRAETLDERFSKGGFFVKAVGNLDKSLVARTEAIGRDAKRVSLQIKNLISEVTKAQNAISK